MDTIDNITDKEIFSNEVEKKIARRQKLVNRLRWIINRMDELADAIFSPEDFTASEYETIVIEYKNLEFEYSQKETALRVEFPYKDIENELKKNAENGKNKI